MHLSTHSHRTPPRAQFNKLNAEVIGISGNDVATQKRFHDEHNLNFRVLADEKNAVCRMLIAY